MKISMDKPKGWEHFNDEEAKARVRQHRLAMREAAMNMRETLAADHPCIEGKFVTRCNRAVEHLLRAIFYRDLARRVEDRS